MRRKFNAAMILAASEKVNMTKEEKKKAQKLLEETLEDLKRFHDSKARVTTEPDNLASVLNLIQRAIVEDVNIPLTDLQKFLEGIVEIKNSDAKEKSVNEAREGRTLKKKEEFEKTLKLLKKEGIKITASAIAKHSSISFPTAQKYLKEAGY